MLGAGAEVGIKKIIEGLNEVLTGRKKFKLPWKQWQVKVLNAVRPLRN